MVQLVSNEFSCVIESEVSNLEDAKTHLHKAQEELFKALQGYLYKVEGSLDLINFYKDRIIQIKKTIAVLE